MNTKLILDFLTQLQANNNRPWFQEHRDEYEAARDEFERGVAQIIEQIATFDPSVSHLQPKDCTYRFYRDVRFSADKSPYKNHFGAYISAKGKKSLHGGYYVHIEPNYCIIAMGSYWLPTPILTAMRNEMMGNEEAWREAVENNSFKRYFGEPACGEWKDDMPSPMGFGLTHLKKSPRDFPADHPLSTYLKMKDYCCWHLVPTNFFDGEDWRKPMMEIMRAAKPMLDFTNAVIDDYE